MTSTGPKPCQSCPVNAIGAMWSCSKPSQPCREMFCTWYARESALEKCTKKYGLVAANATADRARPTSARLHSRQLTSTSGTSRKTPGYLKLVAMPAARPASSIRPLTSSASETATPSVNGTSVTAMREYATCVVSTATATPATIPARSPYARRPSHHDAATVPSASTITTIRAARYDGCDSHAWNGAITYISSVG